MSLHHPRVGHDGGPPDLVEKVVSKQRRISGTLGVVFGVCYAVFFALAALSPSTMATPLIGSVPLGWVLAGVLILVVLALTLVFNTYSATVIDPIRAEALAAEKEAGGNR